MTRLIIRLVVNIIAVLALLYILPGVTASPWYMALLVAAVLGVLNTLIRPAVAALGVPVNLLTVGVLPLILDLILIAALDVITGDTFEVDGYLWPLVTAVAVFVVTAAVNILVGFGEEER